MVISNFWYFPILTAKTQKFDFSNLNVYKIKNFEFIQKPEYML